MIYRKIHYIIIATELWKQTPKYSFTAFRSRHQKSSQPELWTNRVKYAVEEAPLEVPYTVIQCTGSL